MIAALFVDSRGVYAGDCRFDVWDEKRDARKYEGPYPVIAHPPCARWCQLAGLVEHRWGYKRGEDGGCFSSALNSVRRFGGVLEHPAYSMAWKTFGLPRPCKNGGWIGDADTGFSCHVEQGKYGHKARKATWLYVFGLPEEDLPELKWGKATSSHVVSWCGNHTKTAKPRIGKSEASRTPEQFKEVLYILANAARRKT